MIMMFIVEMNGKHFGSLKSIWQLTNKSYLMWGGKPSYIQANLLSQTKGKGKTLVSKLWTSTLVLVSLNKPAISHHDRTVASTRVLFLKSAFLETYNSIGPRATSTDSQPRSLKLQLQNYLFL